MQDSFQSSLIFFRAHKGAVILLITSLSLVFFACLILHSLSRVSIMDQEKTGDLLSRLYYIEYEPADQKMTEKGIEYIHRLGCPIEELEIVGTVELINPSKADEPAETAVEESSSEVVVHSGIVGVKDSFSLLGFDTVPGTPIEIMRGSDQFGGNDVLIDGWTGYGRIRQLYEGQDENTLYLANGETRNVAGIVFIPFCNMADIYVDTNQFFSMTDTSRWMRVIFAAPLKEEQEKQMITNLRKCFSITDFTYPSKSIQSMEMESKILLMLSRILILVCILCSMRLMTYLFLLRKQEFSVIRMLGAGHVRIANQIFAMILMISGISISVGTIAYLILDATRVSERFLPRLSLSMIGSDALFTVISALLIGFTAFFTNTKVDVTRANEEV